MKTYRGFFGSVPMMQHSLARLCQWDDHASTDDPLLDAQERGIFELVVEIEQLWCSGADTARFRDAANKASRVLRAHFAYEEHMLAAVGYPDLPMHAAEHREILADLAAIHAYLNDGDEHRRLCAGLRLSNFMLGLIFGHIRNTDSAYSRYIVDAKERCSTGCA